MILVTLVIESEFCLQMMDSMRNQRWDPIFFFSRDVSEDLPDLESKAPDELLHRMLTMCLHSIYKIASHPGAGLHMQGISWSLQFRIHVEPDTHHSPFSVRQSSL